MSVAINSKEGIEKIVIETLHKLADKVQPPDRLALLLYQFIGDFREFKWDIDKRFDDVDKKFDKIDERFDEVDKKFDKVDNRLDEMVTKKYLKESLKEMVTKKELKESLKELVKDIGASMRVIIKEEINNANKVTP